MAVLNEQIERVAQEICRRRGQDPFEAVQCGDIAEFAAVDSRALWTFYRDDAAAYLRSADEVYIEGAERHDEQMWTPGPWRARHSIPEEGFDVWWIFAGDGNQETDVAEIATVSGGKWPVGKSDANAALIAASPQLFDSIATIAYQLRVSWHAICNSDVDEIHIEALRHCLASADAAMDTALGQ